MADGTDGQRHPGPHRRSRSATRAIHLRSRSTDNAVLDNHVSNTGLRRDKFGEGIYVGVGR